MCRNRKLGELASSVFVPVKCELVHIQGEVGEHTVVQGSCFVSQRKGLRVHTGASGVLALRCCVVFQRPKNVGVGGELLERLIYLTAHLILPLSIISKCLCQYI